MKASDLNLKNSIEFEPETAQLLFNRRRILVLDSEAMGRLRLWSAPAADDWTDGVAASIRRPRA